MDVVVLCLLLLLQFPLISASRLLGHKEACGIYRVDYSDDLNRQVFYVNGILVDKDLFCNTLKFDCAEHCIIQNVGFQYCGLDLLIDELHFKSGRKFIQKVVRQGPNGHNFDDTSRKAKEKHADDFSVTPKKLVMSVPAFFILCCGLICPCCRSRKKETDQSVLVKDPNSMDSTSLEMNFVPDKAPGSPLRVPASPLRVPPSPSRFSMSPKSNRIGSIHLNMNQALKATHNFSSSLKIGEGGFGTVYKAQLPDGQTVAIKRAKKEHFDALSNEFRSEIELLTKIEHRSLVRLLGFVDEGNERLIITEYVPNGTLREHLDGGRGKILDFNQRLEIAIDIAHGLTYLHLYAGEKQIIHRDVKSSNILLTKSMRAKVGDFGFARLGGSDADKTHVSTQVKGTFGYLDPEYMKTHRLTPKSDVYSFGVLLLEVLTGRHPVEFRRPPDERVTLRWVFRKYNEGSVLEMLDPQMKEYVKGEILMKMFDLAIQCAAPTRKDRPDMKVIGEQLWAIRMDSLRNGRRQ